MLTTETNTSDSIDIQQFMKLFWKNKVFFPIFVIFFALLSIYYTKISPVEYSAVSIVQLLQSKGTEPPEIGDFPANMLFSSIDQYSNQSGRVFAKLLGSDFLISLIKKYPELVEEKCKYSPPGRNGLSGFLSKFVPYKISKPNPEQLKEIRANCLRGRIKIEEHKYDGLSTQALEILVKDSDPFYAANLANLLVDHYLETENIKKKEAHNLEMKYLAESIGQAQVVKEIAKNKMDKFLLSHPNYNQTLGDNPDLLQKKTRKVSKFAQLKEQQTSLTVAIEFLTTSIEMGEETKLIFNRSLDFQKAFSDRFVFEFDNLMEKGEPQGDKKKALQNLVVNERDRMRDRLWTTKNILSNMEKEVDIVLDLQEKWNSLMLDYYSKNIYYQELKKSSEKRQVESNMIGNAENEVFSRAVAPLEPTTPKIKSNMIVFSAIGFCLAGMFIIVLQYIKKNVYTKAQLTAIEALKGKVITCKLSEVKQTSMFFKRKTLQSGFKFGFFSDSVRDGKVTGIFDLTDNAIFSKSNIVEDFALQLAEMVKEAGSKVVCAANFSGEYGEILSLKKENNLLGFKKKEDVKLTSDSSLLESNNNVFGEVMNLDAYIQKHKQLDHIFLCLTEFDSEVDRINLLKACNNFILIGKAGRFPVTRVKSYLDNILHEREKCSGFLLVS